MLSLNNFLKEISNKKEAFNYDDMVMMSHVLCKTYGWDYFTLIKQPIPFVFAMIECIVKEKKAEQKALKKKK